MRRVKILVCLSGRRSKNFLQNETRKKKAIVKKLEKSFGSEFDFSIVEEVFSKIVVS